jgi:hypothetical protein
VVLSALQVWPAAPNQDAAVVERRRSENRLVVEVSQASGKWRRFLSCNDEKGGRLAPRFRRGGTGASGDPAREPQPVSSDPELLVGLSADELEALADNLLASTTRARMDEMLARLHDQRLSADEQRQLDRQLQKAEQLTVLKAPARYTLSPQRTAASGT